MAKLHDVVRLIKDVEISDNTICSPKYKSLKKLPAGSEGTIVYVYIPKTYFAVEFNDDELNLISLPDLHNEDLEVVWES